MQHDVFGNIVHLHLDEAWRGEAPLPEFVNFGTFDAGDSDDDVGARKQTLPLSINDPQELGPSPEQQAAYRFLMDNEPAVRQAVLLGLFKSYTDYHKGLIPDWIPKSLGVPPATDPQGLREHGRFMSLEISREHYRGMAYLAFHVDCDWEPEHGMIIVYHRDKPVEWATADCLVDLFESDVAIADLEARPPSQKLLDAIVNRDEDEVRRLLDAGADINDIGTDRPNPPLCQAGPMGNVVWVRRLLALKADPNLKDYRGRTPIDCVQEALARFEPKNWFTRLLYRLGGGRAYTMFATQLREVIGILEAAGGKSRAKK